MNAARHAEIVGAGLGGLNAAIALRLRGWDVTVHEQAPELRMFGAGIWLWENGLRVLRAAGVEEQVIEKAPRIAAWEVRDASGKRLMHRRYTDEDRLYIPVRARVYDSLVTRAKELDIEIITSSPASSARPDGTLVLEDGEERKADLVVAADGHRSRIRESLGLTEVHQYKPEGCTRLVVQRTEEDPSDTAVEHWNGHRRILTCPSSDEATYVCLALPTDDIEGRKVPVDRETWIASFPHLRGLVQRIGHEGRWDVLSYVRCKAWSSGRVAIIGDAAHAQPPNLGQGANLSFANGLGLAVALSQRGEIPELLRSWEARERPLTDHTQRWTNLYGTIVEHWPARLGNLRSHAIAAATRSRWVAAQLDRAAHSQPTGTTD